MIKDYLVIPLQEISRRKLRSLLTLIGIVIGVAAIISLITLGQGLENAIETQFQALGKDKLFIAAKGNPLTVGLSIEAVKITDKDLEIIKDTAGVERAAGMIYSTAKVEFNDLAYYPFIWGAPTDPKERALIGEAQSFKIMKGRSLQKGDKFKTVLGFDYTKRERFDKNIDLGDEILVHDQEFKVVGFLEKIGSPPDDQSVMIPIETYWEIIGNEDKYGILVAQTQLANDPSVVAEKIEKRLRKSRNLEEGKEDFSIETPEQYAESFAIILDIIQIVLIGIAAISLLVGGIGIMNTMYTTVLQRTKEIGVFKAVGARNRQILFLFLIESGFYGLGGGIIGVLIGISFAKLVELLFLIFVGPAFLLIKIDLLLITGTLLFSFLIGCISGVLPAYQASKLKPVDSLHYE